MVRVSRSRLGRESLTNLYTKYHFFFFSIRKSPRVVYRNNLILNSVKPPRPNGALESQTTLKFGSEDSMFSGAYTLQVLSFVPCEARTRGGSQVLCAKNTFFSLSGQALEQNKTSQSLVWVSTS